MPRSPVRAAAAILVLATVAHAGGVSGHLDAVETVAGARRAVLALEVDEIDSKRAVKQLDKIIKVFGKKSTSRSYAHEVKSTAKVASAARKKLAGEGELLAALRSAGDAYRCDLDIARDVFAQVVATSELSKRKLKKLQRNLAKVDKLLLKAGAVDRLDKELKQYSKAAKVLAAEIVPLGCDSGGGGGGGGGTVAAGGGALLFTGDLDFDGNRRLYGLLLDGVTIELTADIPGTFDVPAFAASGPGAGVAFAITGIPESGLYSTRSGGTEPGLVTPGGIGDVHAVEWSPDGGRVAIRAGSPARVHLLDPDGRNLVAATPEGSDSGRVFTWSFDGSYLAFVSDEVQPGHYEVYTVAADGTGKQRHSQTATAVGTTRFQTYFWSPTANVLMVRSDENVENVRELTVVDIAGSTATAITTAEPTTPNSRFTAQWTADGEFFVFLAERDATGLDGLFAVPTEGSVATLLSPAADEEVRNFTAAHQGDGLAFIYGDTELHVGTASNGTERAYTAPNLGSLLAFSRDGRALMHTEADRQFAARSPSVLDASPAQLVVDPTAPGVVHVQFALPDVVDVRSAGDRFVAQASNQVGQYVRAGGRYVEVTRDLPYSNSNRRSVKADADITVSQQRRSAAFATEFIVSVDNSNTGSSFVPITISQGGIGEFQTAATSTITVLGSGYTGLLSSEPITIHFDERGGPAEFDQQFVVQLTGRDLFLASLTHPTQSAHARLSVPNGARKVEDDLLKLFDDVGAVVLNEADPNGVLVTPGTYRISIEGGAMASGATYQFGDTVYDISIAGGSQMFLRRRE